MRSRYFYRTLLLGAFFGLSVSVGNMAAQTTEQDHNHEGAAYTCGSDWARQADNAKINETTRQNNPEVYTRMMARAKEDVSGRAILAGASSADEISWSFFVVDRSSGGRVNVDAVTRHIGEKVILWVDVRDTARIKQATIDKLVEGMETKVKPGPNTRDANKGVVQNDVDIFGLPPEDTWGVYIHILLLDIDNGDLTGGTLSGYFYPFDQTKQPGSNEMNLLYVDSPPLYNGATSSVENVLGTVAHEFQHLINYQRNKEVGNDETHWLYNEGLSEVASLRNGYSDRSAASFLGNPNAYAYFDAPIGSTDGNVILPAYERGMMMCHYLSEQFGDEFLNSLVATTGAQVEPIQKALIQRGHQIDVRDVFTNFWVANYLQNQDNPHGNGQWKYNYAVAGRAAATVAKTFPSTLRTDAQLVRGYSAFLQRYGNPNPTASGLKVRFMPNPREYRATAILFSGNSVIDVRPLTIDQEYTFENFSSIVFIVNSLEPGDATYEWNVEGTTVGVADYNNREGVFAVTGAVPNPAMAEVRFDFRTASPGAVTLQLFDVRGELVAEPLTAERFESGQHSTHIDVGSLEAGVYTARLQSGDGAVAVRQIVIVK